MAFIRTFLIGFANLLIVLVIVFATLSGIVTGGGGALILYGHFNFLGGLIGGLSGFLAGCAAMTVLAVLIDIREALLRAARSGSLS